VVGQNHLRAIGDEELASGGIACRKTGFLELFNFIQEGAGVEDHAVADDALAAGAKDAARDELEDDFLAFDDDGVAGIVASGVAGDDVELF
jgi:hypothetical protein